MITDIIDLLDTSVVQTDQAPSSFRIQYPISNKPYNLQPTFTSTMLDLHETHLIIVDHVPSITIKAHLIYHNKMDL